MSFVIKKKKLMLASAKHPMVSIQEIRPTIIMPTSQVT